MVFRRRNPDACVPGEFYRDVTSGAADYGQRSQEAIRTLIHSLYMNLCIVCYRALSYAFLELISALLPSL